MPEIVKKIIISLILGGLCVSAFFIRLENFKKPTPRTVDEMVYYTMARQMQDNIFEYNATNYALHAMVTEHKKYPEYFHQPLFKHPPLFVLMIRLSVKIFGPSALGAAFFPLMAGVGLIVLAYLLGSAVGGRAVGLVAAGLMFIDPVTIMSSQKVWMDAPLAFFMVLTAFCYWKAIEGHRHDLFFLWGGVAAGAAFMIKFPGLLSLFVVVFFMLFRYPHVFRNKYFWASLALPLLMAVPWALWNYYVYGFEFFYNQLAVHGSTHVFSLSFLVLLAIGAGMLVLLWNVIRRPDLMLERSDDLLSSKLFLVIKAVGFAWAFVFIMGHIGRSLNFFEVPFVTWRQMAFSGEPRWFYLRRLLEYSLLYGFAYLAFFDPFSRWKEELLFLKINAFLVIVLLTAWGNFQCRYILPALPFLITLAAYYICKLLRQLAKIEYVFLRLSLQSLLLILIVLAVSKTMLINYEVSYTNFMCYF